ncbi:MAG: tripartite tricarboxylate transporter TctB family protein [Beijerinckiaceae bacterium]
MKLSDRFTGIFLVLLGIAAFYGGSRLPPVPGQQVGPSVFPMVVGAGLVLMGALIAFGIGHRFEEEAEAELARFSTEDGPVAEPEPAPAWLAWLPPALLVFYFFVSEKLGFTLTAAIMIAVTAFAFNAPRRWILPVAIGGALAIHVVFLKGLRVPLAPGLLPLPW